MASWNMFDSLGDLFGDHYGDYKFWMEKIEEMDDRKRHFFQDIDSILCCMIQIRIKYKKLMSLKKYGWNGADSTATSEKVLELYNALYQEDKELAQIRTNMLENMEQEKHKYAEAALRALNEFNIFDKVAGTVDVTLQNAKNQLERLLRSL